MLSWEHSGFNVWSGEPFTDPDTGRFLGRYLKKSPISLKRMSIRDNGQIGITRKTDDFDETRLFDPLEFLSKSLALTYLTSGSRPPDTTEYLPLEPAAHIQLKS